YNNSNSTDTAIVDTPALITAADTLSSDTAVTSAAGWDYSEDEDKMTSMKSYFAHKVANEVLEFDFPYNGGSVARLTVRKRSGLSDVMLRISSGQFKAGSYDNKTVRVRFGDAPAR